MAYTSVDLENVERAIIVLSTGSRKTRFVVDGDVVEYAAVELPQLRTLRSDIITELAAADATSSGALSAVRIIADKGL